MNQRVELAVWANSPANELREHLDVKEVSLGTSVWGLKPIAAKKWVAPSIMAACDVEEVVRTVLLGPGDKNKMPLIGWSAHKGFFLVDGWSVAFSMRNKLALDSVMLKMESTMTQEIERVVLPGVHYMPFTMQNVSEGVQYVLAEENAAEMQAMVRRAHTVLAEELGLKKGAERMRDDLVRLWAGTGATRADPAS